MRFGLQRVIGPDCPRCGCNGTVPIDAGRRALHVWVKMRCDECDHRFDLTGSAEGPREAPPCQHCGSRNNFATSTPGRRSHRKCRDCGRSFIDAK